MAATTERTIEASTPSRANKARQALPWWLQSVVLLVVFTAGGVTGSMITSRVIHSKMESYRQQAPIFSEDIAARLRLRLQLSDEQAAKVKEILERRHSQMIAFRNEGSQKMHSEFDAMVDEIASVLNEQQAERWRAISDHVRGTYLPARAGD